MEIRIDGLQELERRLKRLPEKVQRVTLIKAVRAGAAPILAAARAKVPTNTGLLRRSLQIKFTRRNVNSVEAAIGVFKVSAGSYARRVKSALRKRQKLIGGKVYTSIDGVNEGAELKRTEGAYYALWVEKGHDIVKRGGGSNTTKSLKVKGGGIGSVTGHVAPRPFLRPAIDENAERVVAIVAQVLQEELDNAERL